MATKLTLCLLTVAALFAQSGPKPKFDIVSIKPHKTAEDPTMMPFGLVNGRYTATNVRLRQLIVAAYVDSAMAFQPAEIDGLRGWAATDGFDVQAQVEAGLTPTKQQTMQMLQAMLEDRFHLKIRREPKNVPVYALVIDADGSKLKEIQPGVGPGGGLPGPGHIRANSIAMFASTSGVTQ